MFDTLENALISLLEGETVKAIGEMERLYLQNRIAAIDLDVSWVGNRFGEKFGENWTYLMKIV